MKFNIMIGKQIYEARKQKGLSQEELSELAKISVRTLQRIESDQNSPRGKTLNLICDVLQLNIEDFKTETETQNSYTETAIENLFLIVINLIIMTIFGFLTLDSHANLNSKIGAVILSLFLPYFIVSKTSNLYNVHRLIKYGGGMIVYIILVAIKIKFPTDLLLGFYPSIILYLIILYYGNALGKSK